MMLDILQAIIEWLLPIFLPSSQLPTKTSIMTIRPQEPQAPPMFSSQDSASPNPNAETFPNGFTGSNLITLKWLVQRHEANLNQLQKQQIEQDIKLSYLSRRLSRREREDILRKRPESAVQASSDEESDLLKRCRCVKVANSKNENTSVAAEGDGEHIVEGKKRTAVSPVGLNAFGQGDACEGDQLRIMKNSPGNQDPRQRVQLVERSRGRLDCFPKREILKNIFQESFPPTPPPRPGLPQKLMFERGTAYANLTKRIGKQHSVSIDSDPETLDSIESKNSSDAATTGSVNTDVPRKDSAPVPESTIPAVPPRPQSAT